LAQLASETTPANSQLANGEDHVLVQVDFIKQNGSLGFSIAGGTDQPVADDDNAVYVIQIIDGGAAARDGRLMVNDRIVEVNGQPLGEVDHTEAVRMLQAAGDHIYLTVARDTTLLLEVDLEKGEGGLGFSIAGGEDDPSFPGDPGVYIIQVIKDGAAHRDGRLLQGDRLVEVNGVNVERVLHQRVVDLLMENPHRVRLLVSRLADETQQATQRFEEEVLEVG
jgi:disks large protein 1